MTLRTLVIVAGLATLAGGCTVTPVEPRQHDDRGYPYDHRVYRETDSYQGYFYVRIIYIDGVPWYVDDYRRVRPIPRHLHSHFQHSTWVRSLPPRFSREREMRDGYNLSRIVYINDVPHYVDDDRRARPMPDRVRSRFDYRVVVPQQDTDRRGDERQGDDRRDDRRGDDQRGDDRRGDERSQPPQRYDDREVRPAPPAYGRDQEKQAPPAYGREREAPPAQGREQERQTKPAYERERELSPESRTETMPRRTEAHEPVRKERDRRAPPVVRDGRSAPAAQVEEQPPQRGVGRDEARPTSQDRGRHGDDEQRGARSQPPAGNEQVRGKIQGVTQPAKPAVDDRKPHTGAAKSDQQRTDAAAEKKNGKTTGRGKDRDEDEREEGKDGDGKTR